MKLYRGHLQRRLGDLQRQLGDYRIERLIGFGGMGEVWAARDKLLAIPVAIKVLNEELSEDEAFAERFEHEAKDLAKLPHARIVKVRRAGRLSEDGRLFIVMDLLRGRTLREMLTENRKAGKVMPPVLAAYYAWQALEGLAVAHEAGIVHRDVKPDNMMIAGNDDLTLFDFGLARRLWDERREDDSGQLGRPSTSALLGTPRYAAPEIVLHLPADARSDLYSLGVVVVEALTGEHVHPDVPRDPAALLRAHVEREPVLQREKNPECPDVLWTVAGRLLEKDPERRYRDADEARAALAPLLRVSQLPQPVAVKMAVEETRREARAAVEECKRRIAAQEARRASAAPISGEPEGAEVPKAPPEPTVPLAVGFVAASPYASAYAPAGVIQPEPTVPLGVGFVAASPYASAHAPREKAPAPAVATPRRSARRVVVLSLSGGLLLWALILTAMVVRAWVQAPAPSATASPGPRATAASPSPPQTATPTPTASTTTTTTSAAPVTSATSTPRKSQAPRFGGLRPIF